MNRIVCYARRIAFATLVAALAAPAVAGWEAFAAQLESLGWTVIEEADGSLRLHPPAAGSTVTGAGSSDVVTVRGWSIAQEDDGSLLLTREHAAEAGAAEVYEAEAPSRPPLLDPAAETRLESLGWQVERAEDGSVLLFPPGRVIEDEYAPPAYAEEPAAEPPPATDVRLMDEATISELRDRGWYVEYADDGSILLYPPSRRPAAEPVPERVTEAAPSTPPAATATLTADFGDDAVLDLLEQRGWTVERALDGSLLLYPRDYRAPPTQPAITELAGACAGHTVAALADGRVTPPLVDLADVQAIAEAWLADAGADGATVGRIRQIFRVYVVSIVDAAPPHRLRHQIAVRRDDGKVILLD